MSTAQILPAAIQAKIDDGALISWRHYSHIFTLKGMEKIRISWEGDCHPRLECRHAPHAGYLAEDKGLRDFIHTLARELDVPVYGL